MELKDILLLIIIQIGAFAGLIIALRLLFYQHLNLALKRLKKLQEETLIKEASLREELERAKKERIAEIERGKEEGKKIIEKAKKQAEAVCLKMEEQAREEHKRIVAAGKEEVGKLHDHLSSEMEAQAINLSKEIFRYIFTEKGTKALAHQFIGEIIEEINKLDKEMFSDKSEDVKVFTSVPLEEGEKKELKNILSQKIDLKITLQEEVDKELIAGVIIKIGEFVIDGSFDNKLKKVIPLLRKE